MSKIFISGIGGSGAYYLARYFLELGNPVWGSDLNDNERVADLETRGAVIHVGSPDLDWIKRQEPFNRYIYSPALPADHPERKHFDQTNTATQDVGVATDKLVQAYFKGQLTARERTALKNSELLPLLKIDWNAKKYFAITGTDGKTTTIAMIYHLLRKLGQSVAMINTLGLTVNDQTVDTGLHTTTPTSQELYQLLSDPQLEQINNVVLEVTSHALSMGRVAGAKFDTGVITNITHEHLDYHGTWDDYFQAKTRLITEHLKPAGVAVLNQADAKSFTPLKTLCEQQKIKFIAVNPNHTADRLTLPDHLNTDYNQANAALALAAVRAVQPELKLDRDGVSRMLNDLPKLSGRMEILQKTPFEIIVDFAHTENSLREVLAAAQKRLTESGQLRVVFGCAGMRDATKRFGMGQAAADLADTIYVCPEDPRLEDLREINHEILRGMGVAEDQKLKRIDQNFFQTTTPTGKIVKIFQEPTVQARRDAIEAAIQDAQPHDIVVICGKGHEKSLCFGTTEYPWSDQATVLGLLG